MTYNLAGKTALVTGASSGLGPYIARNLDAAGASVVIHYNQNESAASDLAESLNNPVLILSADLLDSEAVTQLFEQAKAHTGQVDILVNCAAVESQNITDFDALSVAQWQQTQQANVAAPMVLTQLFAAQEKGGSIVNISSIEASRPAKSHGHYGVSKAALEMLTRSAALELGSAGIRVNAVAPGLIDREGIEEGWPEGVAAWKNAAPLNKLVDPEDIANSVTFLASDASASITGTVITVDCGLSVTSGW